MLKWSIIFLSIFVMGAVSTFLLARKIKKAGMPKKEVDMPNPKHRLNPERRLNFKRWKQVAIIVTVIVGILGIIDHTKNLLKPLYDSAFASSPWAQALKFLATMGQ